MSYKSKKLQLITTFFGGYQLIEELEFSAAISRFFMIVGIFEDVAKQHYTSDIRACVLKSGKKVLYSFHVSH